MHRTPDRRDARRLLPVAALVLAACAPVPAGRSSTRTRDRADAARVAGAASLGSEALVRELRAGLVERRRLEAQLDLARRELDETTRERDQARDQLARVTTLAGTLETDLADLRDQLAEEPRDARFLIEVLGGPGCGSQLPEGPPVPAIDGAVVAVKTDVSPRLVLLSVGAGHRVERGYQFSVHRGNQFVAKVVAERVMRDQTGCRVLYVAEGLEVRPGDLAATRLQ